MKIVGPPVCWWAAVDSPPMSHRSHIASSGQDRDLGVLGGVQRPEQQLARGCRRR
jgi:hypothetical protein